MVLHLVKLSVGTKTLAELRGWQRHRATTQPPLRHVTRHFPRRAEEILAGGSIYWVIDGVLSARQRILDIVPGHRPDGTRCTDLLLHDELVAVEGRLMKPFQGWRYLAEADTPRDFGDTGPTADLPEGLRRELMALALL